MVCTQQYLFRCRRHLCIRRHFRRNKYRFSLRSVAVRCWALERKYSFVNYDYNYGSELWVTDGVTSNIVKDILPGTDGSLPGELVNMNGILYFSAGANPYYIGNGDRELYRSDGTYDGTYKVADIYARPYNSSAPTYLTVVRNQFSPLPMNSVLALWKSDGTAEGHLPGKTI